MSKTEIAFSVHKTPAGGYEARAIDHSIVIQADTIDELKVNAREALRRHFGDAEPGLEMRFVEAWRILGSAKGDFTVPEDFNAPLPKDLEDLFS
jgi:hypothetical protein